MHAEPAIWDAGHSLKSEASERGYYRPLSNHYTDEYYQNGRVREREREERDGKRKEDDDVQHNERKLRCH